MLKFGWEASHPIEYLIIAEPRPAGPLIGYFAGHAIASAVVDCFGRRYVFRGIASRRANGQFDASGLARSERLMEPGLIYEHEPVRREAKRPLRLAHEPRS
jgi:hypothetical protein